MEINMSQIAAWLQPQEILLDIAVRDRFHALETMAAAIGRKHGLDAAPIARALWRREQAASTALGDGFAIPHAQIEGLTRPLTLFMRTTFRIEFNAPDGKPVSDLLAIMVPHDGARENHLQLLAMVARLFSNRVFRRELDSAPDAISASGLFRAGIAKAASAPEPPGVLINGQQHEPTAPFGGFRQSGIGREFGTSGSMRLWSPNR